MPMNHWLRGRALLTRSPDMSSDHGRASESSSSPDILLPTRVFRMAAVKDAARRGRIGLTIRATWSLMGLALIPSIGCHVAATGHNLEGKRLYEQGQYSASLNAFRKALEDDRMNADAYYNMASVYHRLAADARDQAHLQQAEQLYRQAIDLEPNHVDAHRGLAVLYAQAGQTSTAFNLLESWVMRDHESAEPRIELARLHSEYGDPARAKEHLAAAIERDPNNARALSAVGQLHEQRGDLAQAVWMYESALRQNSLQPQLAAHVAALRQSLASTAPSAPFSTTPGTRLVDAGTVPIRY